MKQIIRKAKIENRKKIIEKMKIEKRKEKKRERN